VSARGALLTTRLALAAPLLFCGHRVTAIRRPVLTRCCSDVNPVALRERASGISNVVMAVSLLAARSSAACRRCFNDNLRVALLCITPLYIVGALLIAMCFGTYGDDLAMVVAEAEADVGRR